MLSAYGIGQADVSRHRASGIYQPYSVEAVAELSETFQRLADEALAEVLAEGIDRGRTEIRRFLDLRYRGLDAYLTILEPQDGSYAEAYADEHERLYGYRRQGRPLEIVAARVEVIGHSRQESLPSRTAGPRQAKYEGQTAAWFEAVEHQARVYDRAALVAGDIIDGPAIIHESSSTTVIDPGWRGQILSGGELLLSVAPTAACGDERTPDDTETRRQADKERHAASPTEPDLVLLEIFNNQFAGIAEQMGITLRNTASSVNVKERLDFSCALFTAAGELVVNAPHIPVHLGAMGETVRCILADNPDLQPGDVFVTNNPYRGGSHLPDITVVT
ncbi:MAG: hydantoinase B/oxoprolinase family protein, partial [Pirellulales bacterium]